MYNHKLFESVLSQR